MTVLRRLRMLPIAAVVAVLSSGCGIIPGTGGGGSEITAYFTRAVSLFEGSQVRVLGLPAGSVERVEVEGDLVRVEMSLDGDVPVPADAMATIVPFSLIGERFVQLFPAYTGGPRLEDGAVIPVERTSVPVEPDEALVAIRDFLDDLNPEGTQRLTENLADDLAGQGQTLNSMLANLGQLTRDFGAKADSLGRIIDHFDEFTATLVGREALIGEVLDDFAAVTEVLAAERDHLANIVKNLAAFAADARDLVAEHGESLGSDLEVVEHVAQAIQANIDSVAQALDAAPITATGLRRAYNPETRVIMLRDSGALENSTQGPDALPVQGTSTRPGASAAPEDATGDPTPPPQTPFAPLDELLRELVDRGGEPLQLSVRSTADDRGAGERAAGSVVDFFGRLGGLARSVVGVA